VVTADAFVLSECLRVMQHWSILFLWLVFRNVLS